MKRKFSKQFMQDVANKEYGDGIEVMVDELCDTSRWSNHYYLVFKYEGKYYSSNYSRGATEQQDESPYEYDGDEIEVDEVKPTTKTVIEYVGVKGEETK